MKSEKPKLTEKQTDAIKHYLASRLGSYGIREYQFETKETPRLTFDYSIEQVLESNALGIFRHALKKCTFSAEVWGITPEENEVGHRHLVIGTLDYEHIDGGSNGCKLNIQFFVTDDGKIIEDYR
jgi:hypothetical protein